MWFFSNVVKTFKEMSSRGNNTKDGVVIFYFPAVTCLGSNRFQKSVNKLVSPNYSMFINRHSYSILVICRSEHAISGLLKELTFVDVTKCPKRLIVNRDY